MPSRIVFKESSIGARNISPFGEVAKTDPVLELVTNKFLLGNTYVIPIP
jgi:hypothetical protein